ncbi:MAG: hypothetical protein FJ256_08835, partial [Phycisphaerae bacterium]|nr:hypothetical protein [Phycisphaerae bacterium]
MNASLSNFIADCAGAVGAAGAAGAMGAGGAMGAASEGFGAPCADSRAATTPPASAAAHNATTRSSRLPRMHASYARPAAFPSVPLLLCAAWQAPRRFEQDQPPPWSCSSPAVAPPPRHKAARS